MRCSKCAGLHDYRQHDRYCEVCKAGKGKLCVPKCHNCHGPHFSNSRDCVFYLNRSSKERQIQLRDEFSQKWKEEAAALEAAANSDSGRAARTTIAIQQNAAQAKRSAKPKSKKLTGTGDDDDYVPVGKGGKAKYTFGGMAQALASTTRIDAVDEVVNKDDKDDDKKSDTSSDLRLSYLDDVPLKTRFPSLKPGKPPASEPESKPLTITLPAPSSHKPLRSVTDILRELKTPQHAATTAPPPLSSVSQHNAPLTRFIGGEVAYTPSAVQAEADAFALALDNANLPSQPSPPPQPVAHDDEPSATSHLPTNQND